MEKRLLHAAKPRSPWGLGLLPPPPPRLHLASASLPTPTGHIAGLLTDVGGGREDAPGRCKSTGSVRGRAGCGIWRPWLWLLPGLRSETDPFLGDTDCVICLGHDVSLLALQVSLDPALPCFSLSWGARLALWSGDSPSLPDFPFLSCSPLTTFLQIHPHLGTCFSEAPD